MVEDDFEVLSLLPLPDFWHYWHELADTVYERQRPNSETFVHAKQAFHLLAVSSYIISPINVSLIITHIEQYLYMYLREYVCH